MSNFPILEKQNTRRFSQDAADIAFMQHMTTCFESYQSRAQGLSRCTVLALCPEGDRLDRLCPGYERESVTALDIFCLAAEIVELREKRRIKEEFATLIEEETKNDER